MRSVRTLRMRKDEVGVAVPQILGSDFYAVSVVNKGTGEDISGTKIVKTFVKHRGHYSSIQNPGGN